MQIKDVRTVPKDVDAIALIRQRRAASSEHEFDKHFARMVNPNDRDALCLVAYKDSMPIAVLGGYYFNHDMLGYRTFEVKFIICVNDNNRFLNGFAVLNLARAAKAWSALGGAETFRFSLYGDQVRLMQMLKKHMGMKIADVTMEVRNG